MEHDQSTVKPGRPSLEQVLREAVPGGGLNGTVRPIEALLERLGPRAVFGDPVRAEETTVIPVVEVRTGFGFGGGQERHARPADYDVDESGGSGGGASARVVPRGYLHVTGADVRFVPTLDVTRVAIAGMALAAWIAFVLARTLNR